MLGSGFHTFFQELNRTQWYRPEELKRLQERRLRSIIKHAYDHVPYYHRNFRERKIRPSDVRTIEDLRKLPILTKEDVRDNFNQLMAVNAKNYKYGVSRTSGSTGKPLNFYLDQQNREKEYAAQWRQLQWAGIDFESRIATFRAPESLVHGHGKTKALWKFNALSKELDFDTLSMNGSTLKKYMERLREFTPDLVKGYPSALQTMAKSMLVSNTVIIPKAIQTSSESLSKSQRGIIEEAFNCKIYDWYGQSEYIVSAGQCPEGNYHVNAELGVMELVKDGENVTPGELGEILGTGLYNFSMPFVRYKIGDIGKYSGGRCVCGRGLPTMESLEGRLSEVIVFPDGRILSGVAFEVYWKDCITPYIPNVDYVHVIQKSKNKLLVEMVKTDHFSSQEMRKILEELKMLLGPLMEIEFRYLDSIPIGRKVRFTHSELDVVSF